MLHRKYVDIVLIGLVMLVFTVVPAFSTVIPADNGYVRSLDGTWRFKIEQKGTDASAPRKMGQSEPITTPETFEPFFRTDYREDGSWHDLAVPANWEMAGFSPATYNQPDNASGFYRKEFTVPEEWKGRIVKINFDGVMCGTEVWLNGQPVNVDEPSWGRANYHESGWTAWQADLTPQVKFGQKNLLALRVTKNTKSSNLDSGDYFFLGGVYRPVTLFSVPQMHIEDLTVVTNLLDGNKAEVGVTVEVEGGPATVTARLGEFRPVEGQVSNGKEELKQVVSNPKLWSAEHPNLCPLTVELKDPNGRVVETVTRKIGIREISIKNGVFLVNGVPVKMAGICRHDIYLSKGTALDREVWRKDLELMKAANINAVRTSHYPYGSGFYDLCDEMGFYVVDEISYCWCPTNDAETTPAFLQHARETVRRDKNHPCVVIWAIGNENKAGINQKIVADTVREMDPTRPRLNSCRPAKENGVEFDDHHYTRYERMEEQAVDEARKTWPLIYTENPNVWDVRFGADYGSLDLWAPVLQRCWDVTLKHDGICGGFLWEWQDRAVCDKFPQKMYQYDPATGVNYEKTKGLVDGWRHPRPDYYHVKMVYAPIKVEPKADLTTKPGYAVLDITNRYSFTNLSEIKTSWRLLRDGKVVKTGTTEFDLAPGTQGKAVIKLPDQASADTLRVDFDHPGGWNVVTYQFDLGNRKEPKPVMSKVPPQGLKFPAFNLVKNITKGDPYTWRHTDRYRGSLINVKCEPAISGELSAQPLAEVRSVEADIVLEDDTSQVVGHLKAEYAGGKFNYRADWTGKKADIQELGWVFEMPHDFDHFSWKRQALWSYYPPTHIGRPTGTALPDSANVHLTSIIRPDAFDFNSTKYYCDWASLTNAHGHGLIAEFEPDQRHQCRGGFGQNGAYQLVVNKQCSPPRDISSNQVKEMYLELKEGDSVEGSFLVGSE